MKEHFLPVMSCAQAKVWETKFFAQQKIDDSPGGEGKAKNLPMVERDFMLVAGTRIAEVAIREMRAQNRVPAHIFALVGKGHNGGDAIIAAKKIVEAFPQNRVPVKIAVFAREWNELRPLTMDFYEDFLRSHGGQIQSALVENAFEQKNVEKWLRESGEGGIVLDGIFGYNFRAARGGIGGNGVQSTFDDLNKIEGNLRISVDLPSGLSDEPVGRGGAFVADITCAVGILKTPILVPANEKFVGRIEPLSIGFPVDQTESLVADNLRILELLRRPRTRFCDKRNFGRALIVGGSRRFAGALMMNVLAAVRAGTGLVTAFCPESVHAAFVARVPAVMWIPCKETPDGDLDFRDVAQKLDAGHWLDGRTVNAILCGSGIGKSPDALAIAQKIAAETEAPTNVIFDADAIVPATLDACKMRKNRKTFILPHNGEFARIAGTLNCAAGDLPSELWKTALAGVVKKSHFTWICVPDARPILCLAGTPTLARGGSGDLLAGTVVSLLSQFPNGFSYACPFSFNGDFRELLAMAVTLHGVASRELAREQTEHTADITALPQFFGKALRY